MNTNTTPAEAYQHLARREEMLKHWIPVVDWYVPKNDDEAWLKANQKRIDDDNY